MCIAAHVVYTRKEHEQLKPFREIIALTYYLKPDILVTILVLRVGVPIKRNYGLKK